MASGHLNTEQLLAQWLGNYSTSLPPGSGLLRIRRAEPRFQTRNYFARFKIEIAHFDGTGENPSGVDCFVLEVSETNQAAAVATETSCDSIRDQ